NGEVLAGDQAGGLFRFDPKQLRARAEDQWQVGGEVVAGGLDQNAAFAPLLLPGESGVAYQVACPGAGTELVVRRYRARQKLDERRVALSGGLAGEPVLMGEALVVALADNRLV